MKIPPDTLKKARRDKLLSARLAVLLEKSPRTIDRYLRKNSFPDHKEKQIIDFFSTYDN